MAKPIVVRRCELNKTPRSKPDNEIMILLHYLALRLLSPTREIVIAFYRFADPAYTRQPTGRLISN